MILPPPPPAKLRLVRAACAACGGIDHDERAHRDADCALDVLDRALSRGDVLGARLWAAVVRKLARARAAS
jgi:hypothetical protein